MPISREEILAAAKAMTPAQRYDLIEDIRQILDDDEFTAEQIAEFKRRVQEDERDPGKSISAEDAVAALRDKLRKRRRRRAS